VNDFFFQDRTKKEKAANWQLSHEILTTIELLLSNYWLWCLPPEVRWALPPEVRWALPPEKRLAPLPGTTAMRTDLSPFTVPSAAGALATLAFLVVFRVLIKLFFWMDMLFPPS